MRSPPRAPRRRRRWWGERQGRPALDCQEQQVAMLNVHTHASVLRNCCYFYEKNAERLICLFMSVWNHVRDVLVPGSSRGSSSPMMSLGGWAWCPSSALVRSLPRVLVTNGIDRQIDREKGTWENQDNWVKCFYVVRVLASGNFRICLWSLCWLRNKGLFHKSLFRSCSIIHPSIHPFIHSLSKHAMAVILLGCRDTKVNKTWSFHMTKCGRR